MTHVIEFNWTHAPIMTPKQVEKLEREATKWAEANLDNGEYVISDDATADASARERIIDSLWAFNPEFLSGITGLDERCFKPLAELCEDAQPAIEAMVKGTCGIDYLVEQAIAADGRGNFLATYDNEEHEFSFFVNRKKVWLCAYRTN